MPSTWNIVLQFIGIGGINRDGGRTAADPKELSNMKVKQRPSRCRRRGGSAGSKTRRRRLPKTKPGILHRQTKSTAGRSGSGTAKLLMMPPSPLVRAIGIKRFNAQSSRSTTKGHAAIVIPSVRTVEHGTSPDQSQTAQKARNAHRPRAKKKAAKGETSRPPQIRRCSKKAKILALLRRPGGASLKQLQKATGWQAHSVRGFLSGALKKTMGLPVDSVQKSDGTRCYVVTKM
jgi:hypothetical protein